MCQITGRIPGYQPTVIPLPCRRQDRSGPTLFPLVRPRNESAYAAEESLFDPLRKPRPPGPTPNHSLVRLTPAIYCSFSAVIVIFTMSDVTLAGYAPALNSTPPPVKALSFQALSVAPDTGT
jgi:hypothetical protein